METKTNSDKTKPESHDELLESLDAKYCCFQKFSFLNLNSNKYGVAVHIASNTALVHIRDKSVKITDFTFLKTLFTGNVDDIRKKLIGVNNGNTQSIILINIYSDVDDPSVRYEGFNINQVYNKNDNVGTPYPTFVIEQLNLGECGGLKTLELTVISSYFTPSNEFTNSQHFTNSDHFSKSFFFNSSNDFSKSDLFTETEDFSKSTEYTKSKMFSHSSDFTNSKAFSKSSFFSSSNAFSHTKDFTKSNNFLQTDDFTKTEGFTKTDDFTKTDSFTKTNDFTQSGKFSKSNAFSVSSQFSKSEAFTYSNKFTFTDKFSNSLIFSFSSGFSLSKNLQNLVYLQSHLTFQNLLSLAHLFNSQNQMVSQKQQNSLFQKILVNLAIFQHHQLLQNLSL